MRCPLSGKPCLMPKEVFVTEIRGHETKHLFLCRLCGEQYIKRLDDADVMTKSMEVISSNDGIEYAEHVLDETTLLDQAAQSIEDNRLPNEEKLELEPSSSSIMPQIKKIEAKLQQAIDAEDYESAAQLKDILQALQKKLEEPEEPIY